MEFNDRIVCWVELMVIGGCVENEMMLVRLVDRKLCTDELALNVD